MPTYRASDGASLAYHDEGEGTTTLLLIHGWSADASTWMPLRHILAQRFRVISVDLRGSGASNAAPGPYRIETFASDLADLLRSLNLDPLVVVGHSSGALVAQRLAIDEPDAVKALALLAPVPPSGWTFPPKIDAFMRAVPGNPEKAKTWLAGLTAVPPRPEIARALQRAAQSSSVTAALDAYESWTHADFADEAATIQTPMLIVAPQQDTPMTPEIIQERLAKVSPHAWFVVIPDAGHYGHIDQPERTAALIEAFITDLS
jgi:pimeloyl-ACP methyl ester carboxylesterase